MKKELNVRPFRCYHLKVTALYNEIKNPMQEDLLNKRRHLSIYILQVFPPVSIFHESDYYEYNQVFVQSPHPNKDLK